MDTLAVPGNATSSVAVPAGLTAAPAIDLDDPMGLAPVTAYFQCAQQNIQQVYNGNEDAIIAEAERRHNEVMARWVALHEAILEVESRHHEELSSVKQQAQSSYDKLRVELSATKARVFTLGQEKVAELDALRAQLMQDCKATVNSVTLNLEQGVQGFVQSSMSA